MVFVTDTERVFILRKLLGDRAADPIVDTWLFEGWPDAEAVETVDCTETDE